VHIHSVHSQWRNVNLATQKFKFKKQKIKKNNNVFAELNEEDTGLTELDIELDSFNDIAQEFSNDNK